jgi:ABC-2 type transport system ATP-binding protein
VTGAVVTARVTGGAQRIPGLLRDLDRAGIAVAAAEVRRPTLDDVFLALTGRSLREGADPAARTPTDAAVSTIPAAAPASDLDLLEKAS